MNRISLFPHVGSGNHGCEAIVRSTELLFPNDNLFLFSNHPEEDEKYLQNTTVNITKDNIEISRFSYLYFKAIFQRNILGRKNAFDRLTFNPLIKKCGKNQIML